MSTGQYDQTARDRVLQGAKAPLRWTLVGTSVILVVAGTIVQGLALASIAAAERLGGDAPHADGMGSHSSTPVYATVA